MKERSKRVDVVLNLEVPDDVLVERISKRLTCKCGANYHTISSPPKKGNVCDLCGAEIFQREDDKAETVQNRLNVYKKQTQPLIDYYAKQDILVNIDGNKDVDGVFK